MIDILLIVVIGGMGTMYGAVIGTTIFILAQSYLQDLMAIGDRRDAKALPLAVGAAVARTAGCCGWACCSCCQCISSRPAWSASCAGARKE